MNILIRGVNFENKGAQLMLLAIAERLKRAADARLVMAPTGKGGNYTERAKLGLLQMLGPNKYGARLLWSKLPKRWRSKYGLVAESEVDVVMDASGYGFTEAWGVQNIVQGAAVFKRYHDLGRKVILLPQAFGPVESPEGRAALKTLVKSCTLVFARDRVSLELLETCCGGAQPNLLLAPDFTNLIKPKAAAGDVPGDVFLTLNSRIFDRGKGCTREAYLAFMEKLVELLRARGMKPFVLIHEQGADFSLSHEFAGKMNVPLRNTEDPLEAKAIIGACRFGFSSRFHAVVSALSQGIPVLSVGWSHKYDELMRDYGFNQGMISVAMPWPEVEERIGSLTSESNYATIKSEIMASSEIQKEGARAMWSKVEDVLGF